MIIDQADIEHINDTELKQFVINLTDIIQGRSGPDVDLWQLLADALVRAIRDRRRALLLLEADAMSGDGPGALADSDEAAEDLRRFYDGRR
jgi:hypothetical protein